MNAGKSISRVAVFGGSGFLGHRIVEALAAAGIEARAAVRSPDKAPAGSRKSAVYADVRDETSVAMAMKGCDAAVNAVGLYVEKGAATFPAIHELGARNVAHQAAEGGLKRLVHISGIGANSWSPSRYVRCRGRGEVMVRDTFPRAVILRPSAMFAPDDSFVNALAGIAKVTPVLPLFGRGETRMQPVYAGDVAQAVHAALTKSGTAGETYELGGPDIFTYRQLVEKILEHAERRRLLLPLPFWAWNMLALLSAPLPSPPITRAQVTLMRADNVVTSGALTLSKLGIEATALESVLPQYRF